MPVDSTHKHYQKYENQWAKVRDAVDGEDAVKAKGTQYLPMLSSQSDDGIMGNYRYNAYKERAMFYGAADRTAKGLAGAIMRKDPDLDWPEAMMPFLETCGQGNDSLWELASMSAEEVVSVGRYGLLVDAPPDQENAPPFVATYQTENITNWEERIVEGRKIPVRVHLKEVIDEPDPKDPYTMKEKTQYRVLRLGVPPISSDEPLEDGLAAFGLTVDDFEDAPEGVYYQEIWEQTREGDRSSFMLTSVYVPRMLGGRTLNEIPFEVVNPSRTGMSPEKPPMLDLVNVNYSHYRNSADLEHGRHWTALPTAWAAGFPTEDPETGTPIDLQVGSEVAWTTSEPGARAGYMEFTGAGLGHLAEGMRDKEALMAVLGARLLEEPKKGVEAAETVRLRQSGERSVLARIASTASEGWSRVLKWLIEWQKPSAPEVGIVLNSDFNVAGMTPQELTGLVAALQSGAISWATFFWNLKRGEIVPDGVTAEDEAMAIAEGIPGAQPPVPEAIPEEEDDDDDDETEDTDDEEDGSEAAA